MTHEVFAGRIVAMQERLYRVSASILRQEADREDAVQSCIEKAWVKLPTLKDETLMEHWITRILINECYAILRRQKRFVPVEQIPDSPAPPDADPDLYRFFTSLPDKLRIPMTLHYVEGMDLKEISSILRMPVSTIKTRLHRGRNRMREELTKSEARDATSWSGQRKEAQGT